MDRIAEFSGSFDGLKEKAKAAPDHVKWGIGLVLAAVILRGILK